MSEPDRCVIFLRAGRRLRRPEVKKFAERLRREVAAGRAFHCLLTDDRELRRLNRQFFGKSHATDVLAFPALAGEGRLGEIAVSVERARDQAARFGHRLEEEVGILMLHGLLHLQGLDHEAGRGRMRREESRRRKQLGLPAGMIERVRS